ncbi:hypothetical protein [Streptomyces sp. MB09-02B]|uniref:hypothetical protein n=1 Tax=Streptomyces sp. MB09-02B TaxID=3028667 RepID=UPI0029AB5C03|nr:hypothetical protein [Streptomyces sp. MB09-02B]MDX3643000.1 hypothetical protein [Streptomyces sp. MB09-02B]
MTAGGCSRTLRAAVFAAVCVLLTSLGHVLMSGTAVPWWAMAAGAAVTGGGAWWSGARERGPLLVGSATVAAQAFLHAMFSLAHTVVRHPRSATARATDANDHPVGAVPAMASMDHATGALPSSPSTDPMGMGVAHGLEHVMGGLPSTGMLAAHLLAALLCGLWLAHGERAAFRILRALAGWLTAPLRLLLGPPVPSYRPPVRARRARTDGGPRRYLLTYAITSRGPPVGTAVAV